MSEFVDLPGFDLISGWRKDIDLSTVLDGVTLRRPQFYLFGKLHNAPRLTAWFGDGAYTYSGDRNEPAPMPAWLAEVKTAVEATTGARFNSVLLNLYRDGRDSVAWHADDEPELGPEPTIASWSLGASRTFQVKERRGSGLRHSILLQHGDLLVMSGRSQADYVHAVPKTTRHVEPRVNLTFRLVQ